MAGTSTPEEGKSASDAGEPGSRGVRRRLQELLARRRRFVAEDPQLRPAAVACVLAPDTTGELSLLLTRRAHSLRAHAGQFALPGGRIDAGESAREAARRELYEELGVESPAGAVLGELDDFATRSGYAITPVVLWLASSPPLRPHPGEVAVAFRVRLAELDHPEMPTLRRIPQSDQPVLSVPFRGDFVHAPTAAIIYQLWEMAWRGRDVDVAHYEQPLFAWS